MGSLKQVTLSFQALLKIFQHSQDLSPEYVTGQLLGMENEDVLEISDCFPFTSNLADEAEQEEYQIDMMKSLQEINSDPNAVGWYQTCGFDAFISSNVTEAQLGYQATIPNSIVLIFDVIKSAVSVPSVRAFQVDEKYQQIILSARAAGEKIKSSAIFRELPVKISLGCLEKVFLLQERASEALPYASAISSPSEETKFVNGFFNNLVDCTDDGIAEVGKLQYSLRNILKQLQTSANRNRKRNDESIDTPFALLKSNNEPVLNSFVHTSCQLSEFTEFLTEYNSNLKSKLSFN